MDLLLFIRSPYFLYQLYSLNFALLNTRAPPRPLCAIMIFIRKILLSALPALLPAHAPPSRTYQPRIWLSVIFGSQHNTASLRLETLPSLEETDAVRFGDSKHNFRRETTWLQIRPLPPTTSVTLGNLLNLPGPQFICVMVIIILLGEMLPIYLSSNES